MKKSFVAKLLLIAVLTVALVAFSAACNDKEKLELPDFSFSVVDGETTLTVTEETLKDLELKDFSYTKTKGGTTTTTYYKGIKVSDFLSAISLQNKDGITGLLFVGSDGIGAEDPALPKANFGNAYLAFYFSETADGEFALLEEGDGPARLFDLTEDTEVKSIKDVATITVNRG